MRTALPFVFTLLFAVLSIASAVAAEQTPLVRLDTIGYLPDATKRATVAAPCTHFAVVRAEDGVQVLEGRVSGPTTNIDTRELLFTADFTPLKEAGTYRIEVQGVGNSAPFRIAPDVYRDAFRTVTRGMYLWRCGTSVRGSHQGETFTHAICHTNDALLDFVGAVSSRRDGTGGWHDAGDYNKYVVNAGVTVGTLFRAWEDFGKPVRQVRLGLPEKDGALPEFLAELQWELDWLLKMQASDGSVYHKLSTLHFCEFILPEDEHLARYFTPWSSAATADFVAMMAAGARHFRPYDTNYADRCLAAAHRSYSFLQTNPASHRADLAGFETGGYQTRDSDDRLWAAAELWETTGAAEALHDFEERARRAEHRVDSDFDWNTVGNLGMITYLFSQRPGRDAVCVESIGENLLATADEIVEVRNRHGYERPLGTRYYWGCNGGVARQVIVLHAAFRLSPKPDYRAAAQDALHYLFGRNPYGRSFVTGLGDRPPLHPHDRRSGADGIADPWPGYLVGGPHWGALSWEDVEANYRCNEIAINWNAALIYALAAFVDGTAWGDAHAATDATPASRETANSQRRDSR